MKRISTNTKTEINTPAEVWDTQIDARTGNILVVETAQKTRRRTIDPKVFSEEIAKNSFNIEKLQERNVLLQSLVDQYENAKKSNPKFADDKKNKS